MTVNEITQGVVMPLYKPLFWTSFDAINKIKYAFKKAGIKLKIGHAGTLDPLADGVLVVCTGKCTKLIEQIQNTNKAYTGVITLGATRPSYDCETEIDAEYDISFIQEIDLKQAVQKLTGEIWQKPPIFSAIKQQGKPIYERARKGEKIELQPRLQKVFAFNITENAMPNIHFEIECNKGTYIRSIAHDFGKLCNNGAYLSQLTRTKVGEYSIESCYTIDNILQILQD